MRKAARTDANQSEIVSALRKAGAVVIVVSQLKNFCDILVAYRGRIHIMEIKDGSLPPSARKLTEGELKCKESIESVGCEYNVVLSVDDAIKIICG